MQGGVGSSADAEVANPNILAGSVKVRVDTMLVDQEPAELELAAAGRADQVLDLETVLVENQIPI